jgi:hypothetical protein
LKASLPCPFQQQKQRGSLLRAGSTADNDDNTMMDLRRREVEKAVPVARQQHAATLEGEL